MVNNGSQGEDAAPGRVAGSWARRWAVWAVVGAIVAVGGGVAFWRRPSPPPPVSAAAEDEIPFDAAVPRNPGYLGPQACAACHAARVAEFQATRHFQACREPQAATMPPGFAPGRGTYITRVPGLRFEMTQAGGDFLQTAIAAKPGGEQRASAPIALVYGSAGKADEIYFTWHGDRLYELPMAWLHPLNRWGEEPFNPYGTGDFTRTTTPRCLECHNTWFVHVPGTENQYQRHDYLLGVTCERCHGPGRAHVAFHQAHPGAAADEAIVHPGSLSRERRMDLCAQCHSNATKPRGPVFSYRPGEPLEAYFRTARVKHRENDHVADQGKYLRQSRCFQKSDTLTCTTCHNPHRPTDAAAVRGACLKCHQPAHCAEQERLPAAVRGDCVGCHMPTFTRIQVFFHVEDDKYVPAVWPHEHRIAVYPAARQEVLLRWYRTQSDTPSRQEAGRLAGELVGHWLAEADKFRREYRFLAAIGAVREALCVDPAPAARAKLRELVAIQAKLDDGLFTAQHQIDERRFAEATATLNDLLAVKPDWAKAHGKLGTLYAIAGKNDLAAEHLRAVARYDPDDPYGDMMLGWLAYLQDRPADAVEAYRRAEEIEPFNAKINYHLGLALAQLGRWAEAAARFRQVLTVAPNHAGGYQGLSHALCRQGQPAEAIRFARHAARLTQSQNADVLVTLAEAYADAGRFAEARDTAAQALDVAQAREPKAVPQIRRRLEEWRARAEQAAN
jgi:Flp pilus assembly protein TadD